MAGIGKGVFLKLLKPRSLLGSAKANKLLMWFNAFMKITVVRGNSDEFLITDNSIILKLKNSDGGSGGGGNYRGEYSPDGITPLHPGPFVEGDTVRVTPVNANAKPHGTILPGTYICILDGPSETDLPNHPMSPGGETVFWQLYGGTYPTAANTCGGDGSLITVAVDQQKI